MNIYSLFKRGIEFKKPSNVSLWHRDTGEHTNFGVADEGILVISIIYKWALQGVHTTGRIYQIGYTLPHTPVSLNNFMTDMGGNGPAIPLSPDAFVWFIFVCMRRTERK